MSEQEKREKILEEFERFMQEYDRDIGFTNYDSEVMKGVLALLQAQDPVEPIEYDPVIYMFKYICGSCRHRIWRENHYCPNCGKAVKWG